MRPSKILKKNLTLTDAELRGYFANCARRYKKYPVQKRSGGFRIIAQPTPDLKVAQRTLLQEFLEKKLSIHSSAMAYRTGLSIADNARRHVNNDFLLKMDFKDFFPSLKDSDLISLLIDQGLLDGADDYEKVVVSRILFMHNDGEYLLSIGAPSSPFISNVLLYKFDEIVSDYCDSKGITYTRYSDDLTFSTSQPNALFSMPKYVKKVLSKLPYPRISVNTEKTVFSSRAHNRHVTGVTLTNESKLSIGREKKRSIRTRVFLFSQSKIDMSEARSLQGYVSFANSVDPMFVKALFVKYPKAMAKLMSLNAEGE